MIVGKVFPGGAARTVVLAHGAPLALAEVRPPVMPAIVTGYVCEQALGLGVHLLPFVLGDFALEVEPGAQYLSDAPGLRETAAGTVRCVTIEYLADRAHAGARQVLRDGREKRLRQP